MIYTINVCCHYIFPSSFQEFYNAVKTVTIIMKRSAHCELYQYCTSLPILIRAQLMA